MSIPACPACASRNVAWTGGGPPYGPEAWECGKCGCEWVTPPVRE